MIEENYKESTLRDKEQHKQDIIDALDKLEEQWKERAREKSELDRVRQRINDNEYELKTYKNRHLPSLLREQNKYYQEIEELKKAKDVDIPRLDDVKEELSMIEGELNKLSSERLVMGHAATLLKDSGIKAKIIKTFIPVVNQLIAKYLAALDFFVDFSLNEEFEEKILSRFRDEFSYESFSEGEKMRLNIAVLFTWRALAKLRGSMDCNLVILDELLDGSLDMDGLDNILRLLSNLTSNENVFIISHKTDQLADKFSRVLYFEKTKNFSRIAA
jgi:DNA repair exonuclease SbcCD ATPase subunit